MRVLSLPCAALVGVCLVGCDTGNDCGPSSATVIAVIDGDTIDLDSGERVRYLNVDTPEITNGKDDCYGLEAKQFNEDLVLGKQVTLRYDAECTDQFGRLLAYVRIQDREVNSLMVERGYACVLIIPPNGADRADEFDFIEDQARAAERGMWGACEVVTCD